MDERKIQDALRRFKSSASPINGNSSEPATVGDIKKLIQETSILITEVTKAMKD